MCARETVEFDGLKWHRYPDAKNKSDRRYYKNAKGRLHVYIWVKANGPVPAKHHIHHVDGDWDNNSLDNLQCVSPREHAKEHEPMWSDEYIVARRERMAAASEYAKAWHASPEGREWHREHGKATWETKEWHDAVCAVCAKTFATPFPERTKFCSNNCKTQWRRLSGVDNVTRVCPVCKSSFVINKYARNKTCSRKCGRSLLLA